MTRAAEALGVMGLLGFIVSGVGCGTAGSGIETTGPAVSHEGVAVSVVGQSCARDRNPNPRAPGPDLVRIKAEVRVHNPTASPVTVHQDAFVLAPVTGGALPNQAWGSSEPRTVSPGQTSDFELRFTTARLTCLTDMALETGSAVMMSGRPVKTPVIRFSPSRHV
jgi:hypothetical protein